MQTDLDGKGISLFPVNEILILIPFIPKDLNRKIKRGEITYWSRGDEFFLDFDECLALYWSKGSRNPTRQTKKRDRSRTLWKSP